jgi:hypothetical protein
MSTGDFMVYLYVKTHNVTGLQYFGKTERKDPMKYLGSGKYWLRHLKSHGADITTEIVASFDDREEASQYAIEFSKTHNIVESGEWANLMYETVKDGVFGYSHTEDTKRRFSESSKGMWSNTDFREKMSAKHKEKWAGEEGLARKERQIQRLKGKQRPDHSEKMRGRKPTQEQLEKMRKPKHPGHGALVSAATKGRPKTEEHKQNLKKPKPLVVCRLIDKREMALGNYMKWHNLQLKSHQTIDIDLKLF